MVAVDTFVNWRLPNNQPRKTTAMKLGNEIEHLAADAKINGQAETDWLMLRNVYFKNGTQEEAWVDMVKRFLELGVRATPMHTKINQKVVTKVFLVPVAATN